MVLLLFAAGCGKSTGEVSGTVSYQGKLLPSGTVTFFNQDNQIVGASSINAGKYTIRKVPAGPVKITVITLPASEKGTVEKSKVAPPPKGMPVPPESIAIPSKYGNPEQSGLTYEVRSGPQDYSIELK